MTSAAVLIADISGSTSLYERDGNERALREIGQCLERLQDAVRGIGGEFISSKGDDVLSLFEHPEAAFSAAQQMLSGGTSDRLSIHAGLYWGDLVRLEGNVFGTPVNTAARLAALAKPGELLLGDLCYEMLAAESRADLQAIGGLLLKGKPAPTEVYSYVFADSMHTEARVLPAAERVDRARSVHLAFSGSEFRVQEGGLLRIGRSRECDLVVAEAWVSRHHATISVAQGLVEYTDHSSTGSYVMAAGAQEHEICRHTIVLSGSGTISLGAPCNEPAAVRITYDVAHVSSS